MDRKALIKKLESELRQAHQDYLDGKGIPLEEFDWGLPLQIAESQTEYRVQNEAWTQIELTPTAYFQIKSIYNYIANNLLNEPASYNMKHTIENKLSTISTFPNAGTFIILVSDDISEEFSNVQRRIAKNYIILYRYYEDTDIAFITHIFHQTQDYSKVFRK